MLLIGPYDGACAPPLDGRSGPPPPRRRPCSGRAAASPRRATTARRGGRPRGWPCRPWRRTAPPTPSTDPGGSGGRQPHHRDDPIGAGLVVGVARPRGDERAPRRVALRAGDGRGGDADPAAVQLDPDPVGVLGHVVVPGG